MPGHTPGASGLTRRRADRDGGGITRAVVARGVQPRSAPGTPCILRGTRLAPSCDSLDRGGRDARVARRGRRRAAGDGVWRAGGRGPGVGRGARRRPGRVWHHTARGDVPGAPVRRRRAGARQRQPAAPGQHAARRQLLGRVRAPRPRAVRRGLAPDGSAGAARSRDRRAPGPCTRPAPLPCHPGHRPHLHARRHPVIRRADRRSALCLADGGDGLAGQRLR